MIKNRFLDYIDHKGLITGISNGSRELNDTLRLCGLWFIANILLLRLDLFDKFVSLVGNEVEALEIVKTTEEGSAAVFIQMYNTCLVDKTGWPSIHPDYVGPKKISKHQLVSNLWALLYISKTSSYAGSELRRLWELLLKNKLILPSNDILGLECLTIFARFFKQETRSIFMSKLYSILILFGDFLNMLKIIRGKDDIISVLGPSLIYPTPISNLTLKHKNQYGTLKKTPIDILYEPVLLYLHDKSNTDSIKKFLSSRL